MVQAYRRAYRRFVPAKAGYLLDYHPEAQVYAEMRPEDFLAALGPGASFELQDGRYRVVSPTSLEELKQRMILEQEIDPLFLDYDPYQNRVVGHEGRHRAVAAVELGIERV